MLTTLLILAALALLAEVDLAVRESRLRRGRV